MLYHVFFYSSDVDGLPTLRRAHENVHGRDNSDNGVNIHSVLDPVARLMTSENGGGVAARGKRSAKSRSKRQ